MGKLTRLEELLKATDSKQEFNIVDDLKNLESSFGVLKTKDYRKKLRALVQKYEESELTEVRNAVLEGCREGNAQLIRLYVDYFMPTVSANENDGLLDVLMTKGEEVFKSNE